MSFQEYAESAKGRLHIGEVNRKAVAGALAVLAIACGAVAFNLVAFPQQEAVSIEKAASEEQAQPEEEPQSQAICVHVGGCVASPGVVSLKSGARVADAVEAAGGATGDAALESVNLARPLEDGEQVIIQSAADVEAAKAEASAAAPSGAQETPAATQAEGKVNLNTATAAELQTLSGIGQSKAQKIVDYRDSNGPYKSVDDLLNVSGIGEKTLESIRSRICV